MTTYPYEGATGSTATGSPGDGKDTKAAAADAAKQTAGTAKAQAGEVASTAKAKTGEVASTAKEQARNVVGEAKAQAADITGQLRTQASEQAVQQRDRAATALRSLADELREMANGQKGMASSAAEQVAGRTESLADYLEQREPADLVEDVRTMARRRPGAFLAGAALVGAVAGRFMKGAKAATQSSPSQPARDDYYSDADALALPGSVGGFGAGDASRPHGDPLATSVGATGYAAEGERFPATGPLADPTPGLNDPFGSPTTRGGGAYS